MYFPENCIENATYFGEGRSASKNQAKPILKNFCQGLKRLQTCSFKLIVISLRKLSALIFPFVDKTLTIADALVQRIYDPLDKFCQGKYQICIVNSIKTDILLLNDLHEQIKPVFLDQQLQQLNFCAVDNLPPYLCFVLPNFLGIGLGSFEKLNKYFRLFFNELTNTLLTWSQKHKYYFPVKNSILD